MIKETTSMRQSFDGKTASLRISRCKRNEHSGTYKCVIKNDSGMDECSCTVTVKKVEEKKKKQEEENVEETIEVEEDDENSEKRKGPFDVMLRKAKQNKTVISVSSMRENIENYSLITSKCSNCAMNIAHEFCYMWRMLVFQVTPDLCLNPIFTLNYFVNSIVTNISRIFSGNKG